ncbi:MAG: hypothetical protein K6G48_00280 [Acholeplasmatales bacterium]|nr:hypothetical protein [Acholeplasmatales bacterium]
MKEFLLLCKIQFLQQINQVRRNKVSATGNIIFTVFIALLFIAVSVIFNIGIYDVMAVTGMLDKFLLVVSSLALILIISTSALRVKGTLYGNKDYNLLKTLPIKNKSIISFKLLDIYVAEVKFSLVFILPALGVLIYHDAYTIYSILGGIELAFLLPILPILFFAVVGLLLSLIFDRMRFSQIITVILNLALIIGIYLLIYLPGNDTQKSNTYIRIYDAVKYVDPVLFISSKGLEGSLLYTFGFLGINILLIIISIVLFALTYDKVNMAIESRTAKKAGHMEYKSSNAFKGLFKIQMRRITSSHNILLNLLMGPVMAVLVMVIMYFSFQNGAEEAGGEVPAISGILATIFLMYPVLLLGITPYSSFSISIEGESFWILKVLPLSTSDIFKSKIIPSLIFSIPGAILAPIVGGFIYDVGYPEIGCAITVYVLYTILFVYLGLLFNLQKANIHYKNETEAIKKGSSAIKCLGFGFIILILMLVLLGVFEYFLSVYYAYIIIDVCLLAGILLIKYFLDKNGERYLKAVF